MVKSNLKITKSDTQSFEQILAHPYKILHSEVKLLQIREIHSLYFLKFVHKQQNSNLSELFSNYFFMR